MLVVQESVSQTQSNRRAKRRVSAHWCIATLLYGLLGFSLPGLTGQRAVAAESRAIAMHGEPMKVNNKIDMTGFAESYRACAQFVGS